MALVKTMVRRGRFSKWFDKQAAHTTKALYREGFDVAMTRRLVRHMSISHVLWIEHELQPVAALMLSRLAEEPIYRVQGLTVDTQFRRQGYATSLMRSIDGFVGSGATIFLCVDKDRPSTDWLVEWYRRLGFELAYADPRLFFMGHEIPMIKQVK
jgi:ribosomal protein S18 acetylase RimI-like enzyme